MKNTILLILSVALFSFSACTDSELAQQLETAKKQLAEAEASLADLQVAQPGFIHTVLFWLKEDVTQAQRTAFEKGVKTLEKVESVRKLFCGPPAETSGGSVDNSYDYSVIVYFDNKEGHDFYQKDKTHLALIEAHKDSWERVQVFDVTVDK